MSTLNERRKALNTKIRAGMGEYLAGWKPWRNPLLYVALLLAPAGIAAVILYDAHLAETMTASQLEHFWMRFADALDRHAETLMLATTGVFLLKAVVLRSRTYLLVAVLAACLTWREFHRSDLSKDLVFPLLGVCLVWAIAWWRKLDRPAANPWLSLFLFAALATYALGQLVEKRNFRFLPNEDLLHSQFEELTEMIGHSLLLLSALLSSWRRRPAKPAEA